MNNQTITLTVLILTACGPVDDFEPDSVERGCPSPVIECDDAQCWALIAAWPEWAQYADPKMISVAVSDGVLTETTDLDISYPCYSVMNTDAHVCVATIDCVPILARPVDEINIGPSNCSLDGPWVAAEVAGDPSCWGMLPTVAFVLRP